MTEATEAAATTEHFQTAEGREKALLDLANTFHSYLLTEPGTVLTSQLRLCICHCAEDAFRCQECDNGDCTECNDSVFHDIVASSSDRRMLIDMIHTMIRHPDRLDKRWYEATMEALRSTTCILHHNAVDDEDSEFNRELAFYAAFCEISYLTVMTHVVQMVHFLLQQDQPKLPTLEELENASPPPSLKLRFSSFLTNVRRDEGVLWIPYFVASDVDAASAEFQRIPHHQKFLELITTPLPPSTAVPFAPGDFVMFFQTFASLLYVDFKEVSMDS